VSAIQICPVMYLQAWFTGCSEVTVSALDDDLVNAAGVAARGQDGVFVDTAICAEITVASDVHQLQSFHGRCMGGGAYWWDHGSLFLDFIKANVGDAGGHLFVTV